MYQRSTITQEFIGKSVIIASSIITKRHQMKNKAEWCKFGIYVTGKTLWSNTEWLMAGRDGKTATVKPSGATNHCFT